MALLCCNPPAVTHCDTRVPIYSYLQESEVPKGRLVPENPWVYVKASGRLDDVDYLPRIRLEQGKLDR